MKNKTAIIIPARYASKRFPGKPLTKIAGKEMLKRVWEITEIVKQRKKNVDAVVATDDNRIADFCITNNMKYVMTSQNCRSGTERSIEAVKQLDYKPDFIINLQGDNPLCPPWFVEDMISCFEQNPDLEVITPYVNLSWKELDKLREHKKENPFSGTTVIIDKNNFAIWFSKQIIPAVRKENKLREQSDYSPVNRHIGLYGYNFNCIDKIASLKKTNYEEYEGLEQLAIIEEGISIKMQKVDYRDRDGMSGIDSPADVKIADKIFDKFGEFIQYYKH